MNEVLVTIIAAVPTTVASVAALVKARQAEVNTRGNGKGTLVSMVEDVLDWQIDHDVQHRRLVRRVRHAERDLDEVADTGRIPTYPNIQGLEHTT